MRTEDDKAVVELAVFRKFVIAAGLPVAPDTVRKGDVTRGEPDILCQLLGKDMGFELTEACAPEFAAAASAATKTAAGVLVTWGGDVSHLTVRKKITKRYRIAGPLHLLVYVNGLTAYPDALISAWLEPELSNGLGQFSCVWLFGKQVHRLAVHDS